MKNKKSNFMSQEIQFGNWVQIEGTNGIESTPLEYVDEDDVTDLQKVLEDEKSVSLKGTSLNDYFETKEAYEIEIIEGYGARMSASGYLDSTSWSVFDTEEEAIEYLKETYGDEEEEDEDELDKYGEDE